ncbi:MAG: GAF domain-containing protein [Candidatus Eisenbacteria bacterium]|nr:GAF domain-containing protein [Candidatus Eisenbacteria bacterium]
MTVIAPASGTQTTLRLFERTQRLYGRIDDLPAFLDLVCETLVKIVEEVDPEQTKVAHLWAAAGLLARDTRESAFRPLRLKGRPDPGELRSFVQHVGPGNIDDPTGLMGWSAARRAIALRRGENWWLAKRDDARDGWGRLECAGREDAESMRRAAIAAYPSVQAQLVVPVLDPEMRGQARPRHAIGILSVESDAVLSERFCEVMIAFAGSIGHPLMAALRMRDHDRLTRRLSLPPSRALLARALLAATLPYLPPPERRGWVALRDFREPDAFRVEAITPAGLSEETQADYRAGKLGFASGEGLWGQAACARRPQYLPDAPRRAQGVHRPFWRDSHCALSIPLVTGDGKECLGILHLESAETSYAFSTQDQTYFQTAAAMAAVAMPAIREPRLEYADAVQIPALLQRLRCAELRDVPDDQIVRVNAICRALVKQGFSFPKAAAQARLSVHVLREYTSRSPRVIDVEALRTLGARQEEMLRVASGDEAWESDGVS